MGHEATNPIQDLIDEHGAHAHLGKEQSIDVDRIKGAMQMVIGALGLDPKEEGLQDTPMRFARYLLEFMQPYDVAKVLGTKFSCEGHHNMIAQKGIPFRMICEHHLLPAMGTARIGYVPNNYIVGLSKLTRLVQAVGTARPSLQEYICDKIAEELSVYVEPKGVIVVIEAEHGCMACRGINKPGIPTITSSVSGVFRDVPPARSEFFSLTQ